MEQMDWGVFSEDEGAPESDPEMSVHVPPPEIPPVPVPCEDESGSNDWQTFPEPPESDPEMPPVPVSPPLAKKRGRPITDPNNQKLKKRRDARHTLEEAKRDPNYKPRGPGRPRTSTKPKVINQTNKRVSLKTERALLAQREERLGEQLDVTIDFLLSLSPATVKMYPVLHQFQQWAEIGKLWKDTNEERKDQRKKPFIRHMNALFGNHLSLQDRVRVIGMAPQEAKEVGRKAKAKDTKALLDRHELKPRKRRGFEDEILEAYFKHFMGYTGQPSGSKNTSLHHMYHTRKVMYLLMRAEIVTILEDLQKRLEKKEKQLREAGKTFDWHKNRHTRAILKMKDGNQIVSKAWSQKTARDREAEVTVSSRIQPRNSLCRNAGRSASPTMT
jgi:hypothetical protein